MTDLQLPRTIARIALSGLILLLSMVLLAACGTSAVGGRCGTDADCDDENPCTLDTCDDSEGCLNTEDVAALCDDGNPCTLEMCDPESGCSSDGTGVDTQCDDNNACTTNDVCQGDTEGSCQGVDTSDVDCDDGNSCTTDICTPQDGCQHDGSGSTAACDDGNVCTSGDQCQGDEAGTCLGEDSSAPDCDDGNPCTADACDPVDGCVHQSEGVTAQCDDGNACTTDDVCQGDEAGTCQGTDTSLSDCDDGSVCTVDSCDPTSGCVHDGTDIIVECDDMNACTVSDSCQGDEAGTCQGSSIPASTCFDDNPCTSDYCSPAIGCVNDGSTVHNTCNDGNACTTNDRCQGDVAGTCQGTDTSAVDCDDGNLCTVDSCVADSGCAHDGTGVTATCNDLSMCTENDQCLGDVAGTCQGTDITAALCDDGNDCTEDTCHATNGCRSDLMADHACFPNIAISYPPRGATIQGSLVDPVVVVTGTVTSGAGPISSFTLNGVDVPLSPDGSFSQPVSADLAGNTLVFEATDSFDSYRKRVQAFLWSTEYRKPTTPKNGMVTEGMAFWLAQEVLDDGDHSLPADDFATIFELVMAGFDIAGLLPNPLAENVDAVVGTYDVSLTNVTYSAPTVSLDAINGGMHIMARINNFRGDLHAEGSNWLLPDLNGTLTIPYIIIDADVMLSVDGNHNIVAQMTNVQVDIANPNVDLDGFLGGLLEGLINGMIGDMVGDLETQFSNEIGTQIEPILSDALGALAINTSFDLPSIDGTGDITLSLVTDFQATDFTPAGGAFILRAASYASQATPYDNLGVPGRVNCGNPPQILAVPKNYPFEITLADDTLNQLLYSAWNGGLLEFPVPADMIDLGDLSEYGIGEVTMDVSAMLAPTASDCNPDGSINAFIGDLLLHAYIDFAGNPLDLNIWASMDMGLELTVENSEIAISILGINDMETEVSVVQPEFVGLLPLIGPEFETMLVDLLLGALGGETLAAIPIPEIDLSASVNLPPGSALIALDPQAVDRVLGNTVIGGDLQ